MRRRLLLAAALLLAVPATTARGDDSTVDPKGEAVLEFRCGAHRWVIHEREARTLGAYWGSRLGDAMKARGFEPTSEAFFVLSREELREVLQRERERLRAAREARDRDAAELVAGGGRFPKGYVPAGREKAAEIPPLDLLGGKVVLEIVDGEARARVTEAPEGSRARKIGLREGDWVLEVGGKPVGPAALLDFQERLSAGAQQGLRVRRTHGEIERIVIDSWDRAPSGR